MTREAGSHHPLTLASSVTTLLWGKWCAASTLATHTHTHTHTTHTHTRARKHNHTHASEVQLSTCCTHAVAHRRYPPLHPGHERSLNSHGRISQRLPARQTEHNEKGVRAFLEPNEHDDSDFWGDDDDTDEDDDAGNGKSRVSSWSKRPMFDLVSAEELDRIMAEAERMVAKGLGDSFESRNGDHDDDGKWRVDALQRWCSMLVVLCGCVGGCGGEGGGGREGAMWLWWCVVGDRWWWMMDGG
jgi:hypothetical protein